MDLNLWPIGHQGTILLLRQCSPSGYAYNSVEKIWNSKHQPHA